MMVSFSNKLNWGAMVVVKIVGRCLLRLLEMKLKRMKEGNGSLVFDFNNIKIAISYSTRNVVREIYAVFHRVDDRNVNVLLLIFADR